METQAWTTLSTRVVFLAAVALAGSDGGADPAHAVTSAVADPARAVRSDVSDLELRSFFLDCHCDACAPLAHLGPGRYWIVSRPILAGSPDDFESHIRRFRTELSERFHDSDALSRTVVLRHRPSWNAARATRRAVVERRASQGYRVLDITFRTDDGRPFPGAGP